MISLSLEHILNKFIFVCLMFATLTSWLQASLIQRSNIRFLPTLGIILSNIIITIIIVNRWFVSKHFPLSNLYESTIFLSWSLTAFCIFLEKYSKNDWLIIIIAPSAMITYGFGTIILPPNMQDASLLVPALQSNWLIMHVTMMIFSYGALVFGCLLAVTLLGFNLSFMVRSDNNHSWTQIINQLSYVILPIIGCTQKDLFELFYKKDLDTLCLKKNESVLIDQLDHWSFRIIAIGFPLLTIGIVSGAVWANEAWGSYWNWDPKETWALITWLIFAIYLHSRINHKWDITISSLVASLGFGVVWICYLGVNLLGKGLHSYGWFS